MYEIALCDDDSEFASAFKQQLKKVMDKRNVAFHLAAFSDPGSLQAAVESGERFDLLFLDIVFGEEKGLMLAGFLREHGIQTEIIFVTSCPEYAVASYDYAPLHYLTKPIDQDRLTMALSRFLDKYTPRSLHFTTARGDLYVQIRDIAYFEIYGHQIVIHKTDGARELCTGTLKEIEHILPTLTFIRPHRSYLVSLDKIAEIVRYQIRLSTGDIIPVSRSLYQQTQRSIIEYADRNSYLL